MKPSYRCNFVMVLITFVVETSSQCDHTLRECEVKLNSGTPRGNCPPEDHCDIYSCATEYSRGYEVHILGIYDPPGGRRGFQRPPGKVGDVMVSILGKPGSDSLPLKLVLSSYEAAHWTVHVPRDRPIEDIQLYSYYESYSTITVLGNTKQPNKVITHGYLGYGESRLYRLFLAVERRFGFVTSLTGTSSTDSWVLNVGAKSPCIPTQRPDVYDVRLVDGDETSGTVQLYIDDMWIELQETKDPTNIADVACRQLFPGRVNVRRSVYKQCPTSPLWTASCKGSESKLRQCWLHPLRVSETTTACNQSAVRVRCDIIPTPPEFARPTQRYERPSVGDLRLVNGGPGYGRVEIYFFSRWGTICDDEWGDEESNVLCKTLGFRGGGKTKFYGEGAGSIWLNRVNCASTDSTFQDCARTWPLDNQGVDLCTHAEDVGVECIPESKDAKPNGLIIGCAVTFAVIVLIMLVFVVRFIVRRQQKIQSARAVRYHPSDESVTGEADIQNVRHTMRDPVPHAAPANPVVNPSPVHPSAPPPPDYHDQAPPSYQEAVHFSQPTAPPSGTADPPQYDALFQEQSHEMPSSSLC